MLGLLGLIPTILTFITGLGGTATSISKDLRDREVARTQAQSNQELRKIDAEIAAVHDRKDVLVAEAGSRLNSMIRAFIAIGPGVYVFKYFFVDKFLGSLFLCSGDAGQAIRCKIFATDALNTEMAAVMTAVIAFYFLATAFGKK